VGVAADVRHGNLAQTSRQVVYYPHAQRPEAGMELVVRSAGAPAAIIPALRDTIRHLDPDLPVNSVKPMSDIVRTSLLDRQVEFALLGAFAVFALLLAAAGIYGVMSYAIGQRIQEFGIRLALGATSYDIIRLVGGYGARLAVAGFAIGLLGAAIAGRLLRDLLFGVGPTDPRILGGAVVLLGAVAIAACVVPARRALRVDPINALRAE
jgi:ABC-type antimicrobial peptide transport system permease subunit